MDEYLLKALSALRKETGSDAAWEEAFAEGARLSLEEAVKVALA